MFRFCFTTTKPGVQRFLIGTVKVHAKLIKIVLDIDFKQCLIGHKITKNPIMQQSYLNDMKCRHKCHIKR